MSKYTVGKREYRCSTDCEQFGCPGHEVQVQMDCSTDIYIINVDGRYLTSFDENLLEVVADIVRS